MTEAPDLFEHLLFRIAGESFSLFKNEELQHQLKANLVELASLTQQKETLKLDICDILFILINVVEDQDQRKIFINLKRDIFNGRNVSPEKINKAKKFFTEELLKAFDKFELINSIIKLTTIKISEVYPALYEKDLSLIKQVCNKENFQKGLLLSSEILLKYAKRIKTENIDENTILGLWKYITRTIGKTTPFSTFTQLNIGTIKDNLTNPVEIQEVSKNVFSEIRYNNYVFEIFLLLIKTDRSFFKFFNVKINSSEKETDTGIVFFTNNNNTESFQTISKNDIVILILEIIRNKPEINVEELSNEILKNLDDNFKYSDVENYIFELIQTGLLEINISLSGLDSEWDKSLYFFIENHLGDTAIAKSLAGVFRQLILKREVFKDLSTDERLIALADITDLVSNLYNKLKENNVGGSTYSFINLDDKGQNIFLHRLPEKSENMNVKNLIYEDTSRDINIAVDKESINSFVSKVNHLMHVFSLIPYIHPDKQLNYNFYLNSFHDYKEVNLLAFYERFYRTKSENPDLLNQFSKIDFSKINTISGEFQRIITQDLNNGKITFSNNECYFDHSFTNGIVEKFSLKPKNNKISYSLFVQLFQNSNRDFDKLSGVLNGGMMPGRGKMISRFLHLFPISITDDLIRWNIQTMDTSELFVENSDASFFNANLHPRILPYEIDMPGGNTRDEKNLINVSDLKVRPNTINNELELYHKNGQRVIVHDLGFQNQLHRSNLYRLLCLFGNNTGYPFFNIVSNFSNMFTNYQDFLETQFKVTILPRIVFDSTVILQRKQWQIPIQAFNELLKSFMTSLEFYIQIQKWRISMSIPDEVFVRLHRVQNPNEKNALNKDDYKPQYINFFSPLCIRTLEKIINKVELGNLIIEEMSPSSSDLLDIGNEKFAMESLIQWQ